MMHNIDRKNSAHFIGFISRGLLTAGCALLIAVAESPSAQAQVTLFPSPAPGSIVFTPNLVHGNEVPTQPVSGLTIKGLTFTDTSGATIDSADGGQQKYTQDPVIEGNTGGESITIMMSPTKKFAFGFALSTQGANANAGTVTLFNGATNLGTFTFGMTQSPGDGFSGGYPVIGSSIAFNEVVITFNTGLASAFGLGNIGQTITILYPILENAAPVNTPTIADFIVSGAVQTIGANNTVNSLTFLPGSSLDLNGNLTVTQGPINLPNGASIFGTGMIFGSLINAGSLTPGDAPGTMGMSGNFTQTSTGVLNIEIGGRKAGQFGLLAVGGIANLGGTLNIEPYEGFQLQRGEKFTFLTAAGGVFGKFSQVDDGFATDTILDPTVVYGKKSVSLEVPTFTSFAEANNFTPNELAVAQALDSTHYSSRVGSLISFLDSQNVSKLAGDFDRIAPSDLTSMFTVSTALAEVQSLNIQRRTEDIRSGSSGFSASRLAINGFGPSYSGGLDAAPGVAGPSGNDGKESKEVAPPAPVDDRLGVFLSGTGQWVSVDGTGNPRGYTLDSGGFTLGVDYKVTPNFAIGLAAGYTGTTADLQDHGRVWVNGGKLGLYATIFQNEQSPAPAPTMSKDSSKESSKEAPALAEPSVAKGFYLDLAAFGGLNGFDTRRSALQGDARGDTDGGELNVLVGAGYDFKMGGLTFGPTASFNYTYVGLNGFTEHDSLAPLNINSGDVESLRSAVGAKLSYNLKLGGVLVIPEVRASWQHEYGNDVYDINSSLAGGAGDGFTVQGPKIGRDSALIGAGFAIQCNERCSVFSYYDGDLGRRNFHSNAVTGGIRLSF